MLPFTFKKHLFRRYKQFCVAIIDQTHYNPEQYGQYFLQTIEMQSNICIINRIIVRGYIPKRPDALPIPSRLHHPDFFKKTQDFKKCGCFFSAQESGMPHCGRCRVLQLGKSLIKAANLSNNSKSFRLDSSRFPVKGQGIPEDKRSLKKAHRIMASKRSAKC